MTPESRIAILEMLFGEEPTGLAMHSFHEVFPLPNGEQADEAFLFCAAELTVIEDEIWVVGYEVHFSFKNDGKDCEYRIRWRLKNTGATTLFEITGDAFPVLYTDYNPRHNLKSHVWNEERYQQLFDHLLMHFTTPDITRRVGRDSPEFKSYKMNEDAFFYRPE